AVRRSTVTAAGACFAAFCFFAVALGVAGASATGVVARGAAAFAPASRMNRTGVNVSLLAFLTPLAPNVMTPHWTWRQSNVVTRLLRSYVLNTGAGIRRVVENALPLSVPPLALDAVSLPGNAMNRRKPRL